jgi:hypothetical protein
MNNSGNRMRTVRESFPSHGSSLTKAPPDGEDPQPRDKPGVWRLLAECLGHLAILECGRYALCFLGQQLQDAPSDGHRSSFAFPGWKGSTFVLATLDQTDVGLSDALHLGFSFFGRPNAAPAEPALRLGRPRPAWPRTAAFPCSAFDTGYVRSALYTGSPVGSASGGVKHPNQTACHFGQSLKQPRVALSASRCLRAFSSFDHSFQF